MQFSKLMTGFIISPSSPQTLRARGYERLVLQVGRGSLLPAADSCPHIRLEAFRFKSSIAEDIKQADLVISHAGKLNIKNHSILALLRTVHSVDSSEKVG